jgi:hypothetical protein
VIYTIEIFKCIVCLYKCIAVGDQDQEGRIGIPLTVLPCNISVHVPRPGPGFPTLYVVFFFCSVSSVKMKDACLFILLILVELMTITV